MKPAAIFLYELSGKSAEPFAAAGWDCYCIDIQQERNHSKGKGLYALSDAIELFAVAAEWADFFEVPYLIENPRSTISTYWRKPDHRFDPADYSQLEPSDHYTKKMCLWTGGSFIMPPMCPLPGQPLPNVIRDMADKGRDRANARSVTPMGFMRAVYQANFPAQVQQVVA